MNLTSNEQYLLELINRGRLDPALEAQRYGLGLNAGLPAGTIGTDARQVLAPNTVLNQSAQSHSQWMLDEDVFAHQGLDGSNAGDRIAAAGYELTGAWSWRENLAWSGTTGTIDLADAIESHHEGLYRSEGHRVNTFDEEIKEVGISQLRGAFTNDGTTYDSSMVTLNFTSSGTNVFVTGVAFQDRDGDSFYSIGEGRSNIWIAAEGWRVFTTDAGGYGLAVSGHGSTRVEIGQGGATFAQIDMDMTNGNGKLDLMIGADGSRTLLLSADATLISGLPDATLLGVADLELTGNEDDNVLTGNRGDNILDGAGGADQLFGGGGRASVIGQGGGNADWLLGGAGNDRMSGQAGADILDGGAGNDMLTGGGGRDTFVFTTGRDEITDFTDNVDQIEIETDLTLSQVMNVGEVVGSDVVFDFGDGDVLILRDVTDIDSLANDLIII